MPMETGARTNPQVPRAGSPVWQRLMQVVAFLLLWSAVLFASAGRLDWTAGWVCVALYVLGVTGTAAVALRKNPAVIAARGKWHKDTKPFDKVFVACYLPLIFLQPAVAGLDAVRFGWSSLPSGTLYGGALLYALATVLVAWTMAVNPHLETTVRIQSDRGHMVVTSGPYRVIRHPMYAGILVQLVAVPLILGSAWAFAVSGALLVLLLWRTSREDTTLRKELAGYEEYAGRTRYRLVPGIW